MTRPFARALGLAQVIFLGATVASACSAGVTPSPSATPSPIASVPPGTPAVSPSTVLPTTATLRPGSGSPLLEPWFGGIVGHADGFVIFGASSEPGASPFVVGGSGDALSWTRQDASDFGTELTNIAAGARGWIASQRVAGTGPSGVATALWHSADGVNWERLADQAGLDGAFEGPVYAGDAGFAMVGQYVDGQGTSRPTLWTSPDGQTWTEAAELRDKGIDRVVVVPQGFIGYGSDEASAPDGIYTSVDGMAWELQSGGPVEAPASGEFGSRLLVASGSRVTAWRVDGASGAIAVWSSEAVRAGGGLQVEWTRRTDADATFAGSALSAATANPATTVALGYDRATRAPISWTSSDGTTWRRTVQDVTAFGGGVPAQISASRDAFALLGFVVNGAGEERRRVWRSDDGAAWSPATDGDLLGVLPPDVEGPCPDAAPAEVSAYLAMSPSLWPACFGSSELHVRGFIMGCGGCGGATNFTTEPSWLFDPLGYSAFWLGATDPVPDTGPSSFGVMVDPARPITVPAEGTFVELTGHFADPAATSCRIVPWAGSVGGLPPAASAVATCMRAFVVTAVRPQ